ncbi:unnamed protein product [Nyctereutes procyonoides]|uniref:Protein FAM136A n=1 Tax=Nyctereutes procyonoides TaxID=34880 RepID=A0A811Y2W2_NYCPR|nr:unnamed protein product [Nyctereutes procyonoides]
MEVALRVATEELQQLWVQEAVDSMMHGLMFWCNASCCENSQGSMKLVLQCTDDRVKDSIDTGSKEFKVKQQLENCVTRCVDDHIHAPQPNHDQDEIESCWEIEVFATGHQG